MDVDGLTSGLIILVALLWYLSFSLGELILIHTMLNGSTDKGNSQNSSPNLLT